MRLALAALSSPLLFTACVAATPPHRFSGPAPTNAHDRALARFAERFLDRTLALDPVRASALGYRRYDGRFPDLSPAGVSAAVSTLERLTRELRSIDEAQLSSPYAVDHRLMLDELRRRLFARRHLRAPEWDPKLYHDQIDAGLHHLLTPPPEPAGWPTRLDAILDRLEALPGLLETARARLEAPPLVFTRYVADQNRGHVRIIEEALPPLFTAFPDRQARFEKLQALALDALERHQAYLDETLPARSTGDWRLGPTRYARKLTHALGTSMSPAAVFAGAERGLAQVRAQMYEIAEPLFREHFPDDPRHRELTREARTDYIVGRVLSLASSRHGAEDSPLDDVRAKATVIQAWLRAHDFIELPPSSDAFVIAPAPPFLDGLAVAFYDPAPTFQPELEGRLWISRVPDRDEEETERFLRAYNTYVLDTLTIHEAFPGHYLQRYWSSRAPSASVVKRALASETMAEGWAIMVEQLMHEEGWGREDPFQRLFHLKVRARIYIDAMVDVRLHSATDEVADANDPWALDIMTRAGFQEVAQATRTLRRAKLTSTQLSAHYVGYQEMLDLYRELMASKRLTPKEARMKMLSYGTIAPRLIRRRLVREGLL